MTLTLAKVFLDSPSIVIALKGAILGYWPNQSTNKRIMRKITGRIWIIEKTKNLVELHIASNKVAFSHILLLVLSPYPLISRSSSLAIVL
jgi:GTP-sensing pleiotropic transcriptional regulator CodY